MGFQLMTSLLWSFCSTTVLQLTSWKEKIPHVVDGVEQDIRKIERKRLRRRRWISALSCAVAVVCCIDVVVVAACIFLLALVLLLRWCWWWCRWRCWWSRKERPRCWWCWLWHISFSLDQRVVGFFEDGVQDGGRCWMDGFLLLNELEEDRVHVVIIILSSHISNSEGKCEKNQKSPMRHFWFFSSRGLENECFCNQWRRKKLLSLPIIAKALPAFVFLPLKLFLPPSLLLLLSEVLFSSLSGSFPFSFSLALFLSFSLPSSFLLLSFLPFSSFLSFPLHKPPLLFLLPLPDPVFVQLAPRHVFFRQQSFSTKFKKSNFATDFLV